MPGMKMKAVKSKKTQMMGKGGGVKKKKKKLKKMGKGGSMMEYGKAGYGKSMKKK